jgi:FkbM family methyltransferase
VSHYRQALWKRLLSGALGRVGYRVARVPGNRFDAMVETLAQLARRGYRPRLIIDGGANFGQWATRARAAFPEAALHLVEPQPACAGVLEEIVRSDGNTTLHACAITAPGVSRVRMVGGGESGGGSGAFVARDGESEAATGPDQSVPAATLDQLFAARATAADRILLKLDLEGHELDALAGAATLLASVEAILCEVQFYDIGKSGRPTFAEISRWLGERGFHLHDFAALSSRARDGRLRMGDVLFLRDGSALAADPSWA